MKMKLLVVGVLSALATLVFSTTMAKHCYPQTAVVTEINYGENLITAECFNGNQFQFTETEDWIEGDICSMIMFDGFTDNVRDDIILKVQYDGFLN